MEVPGIEVRPGHEMDIPTDGHLSDNITHFARALRKAGLSVGPGRVIDAVRAVEAAGFTKREDFYHTLEACFVSRPEHRQIFAQIFKLYWRDPQFLDHMMRLLRPIVHQPEEPRKKDDAETRAAEALLEGADAPKQAPAEEEEEITLDASMTFSEEERLRSIDFEQMSAAETIAAKQAIARIALPVNPIVSRRTHPARDGRLPDWAGTLRSSMRRGGELHTLEHKSRRKRWPNLVVLCDISGSMSSYSRMLLHFLHAASNAKGAGWAAVHAFTFGTRLTNITRHLRRRDVDEALRLAGQEALDWEGGTRIGESLLRFNRDWSRRVLGQGAVVLLITDGLDRDEPDVLAREAERLQLSCRRLIWLNPLLRWDGFAPRARGVRALLPHVDVFCSAHSVGSLEALASTLTEASDRGERDRLLRVMAEENPAR